MPGHPIGVGVREMEAFDRLAAERAPATEHALPANEKGLSQHGPASPAIVPGRTGVTVPEGGTEVRDPLVF